MQCLTSASASVVAPAAASASAHFAPASSASAVVAWLIVTSFAAWVVPRLFGFLRLPLRFFLVDAQLLLVALELLLRHHVGFAVCISQL
jgi:hypothetical protein